jgi:hypothetical protein
MNPSVDMGRGGPAVVCPAGGTSTEADPERGPGVWPSRTIDNHAQPHKPAILTALTAAEPQWSSWSKASMVKLEQGIEPPQPDLVRLVQPEGAPRLRRP